MVVDGLVLGTFDRTIGGVSDVPEILHKTRINAKDCVFVALGLHDVTNGQGSHVTAVLEIPRVQRLQADFVEDLASFGPFGKYPCGSYRRRAGNVFVLVVFLGSANNSILNDLLYDLSDFAFGKWDVDDEPHAILGAVFFPSGEG